MSEIYAVVEGPAEQVFVRDVLAPWLGFQGVYLQATPIGGNRYADARLNIINFLKQRNDTFVTCLFDYYGMKQDWPNRENSSNLNYDNRPRTIESGILEDVAAALGGSSSKRFIPYVQMYEFEALLFSYPAALSKALAVSSAEQDFQVIKNAFATPEHINDSETTAPSKRIIKIFKRHGKIYKKPFHGSIAAKATTIETMLDQCPRFHSWVNKLIATVAV